MLVNCSLPEIEHEEHQEVDGLFDECWFVSNIFLDPVKYRLYKLFTFGLSISTSQLFMSGIKVEVVVGEDGTE